VRRELLVRRAIPAWLVKLAPLALREFPVNPGLAEKRAKLAIRESKVSMAFKDPRALGLGMQAQLPPKATSLLLPLRAISMLFRPQSQLGVLFGMTLRQHGKTQALSKVPKVLLARRVSRVTLAPLVRRATLLLVPLALRAQQEPKVPRAMLAPQAPLVLMLPSCPLLLLFLVA
jgi:hypothetical protein